MKLVAKYFRVLLAFFPSKLPITKDEFNSFCDDIFDTYDLKKDPTYKHAIATAIMHVDQTQHRKPKRFFYQVVSKAISNQVCYGAMQDINDELKLKAEQEKLEATSEKVSDESHDEQFLQH